MMASKNFKTMEYLRVEELIKEGTIFNDYIHIHVIPSKNTSLLNKSYPSSGKNMEETWRSSLNDQSKYVVVSPKDFIKSIDKDKYRLLLEYLDRRYW